MMPRSADAGDNLDGVPSAVWLVSALLLGATSIIALWLSRSQLGAQWPWVLFGVLFVLLGMLGAWGTVLLLRRRRLGFLFGAVFYLPQTFDYVSTDFAFRFSTIELSITLDILGDDGLRLSVLGIVFFLFCLLTYLSAEGAARATAKSTISQTTTKRGL